MKAPAIDPVVDEIREARRQISARFGHDPRQLVAHYLQRERERQAETVSDGKTYEENEPGGPLIALEPTRGSL